MFGIPESVLIFAALTIVVGLVLLAGVGLLPKATRTVARVFWCPFRRTDVTVEFEEDSFGRGRYLGVKRCTAFAPTSAVTCGKPCLYLGNLPPVRGLPKAA
ncbi:MAG: hypothetical protein HY725_08900 [Candidatus Rokubacteria bacterium]|nr:hypothetical protein [Candidatus Rokubacteria bacterium]